MAENQGRFTGLLQSAKLKRPGNGDNSEKGGKIYKPSRYLAAKWPYIFPFNRDTSEWEFQDPRPHLVSYMTDGILPGESLAYACLMAYTYSKTSPLCAGSLHGFRCQGTYLKVMPSGSLKLVPLVGPNGWNSQHDYDEAKEIYLVPHLKLIVSAIKKLEVEFEARPYSC